METEPEHSPAFAQIRRDLSEFKEKIFALDPQSKHLSLDVAMTYVERQTDLHLKFSRRWDLRCWMNYLKEVLLALDDLSRSEIVTGHHQTSIKEVRELIQPLHETISVDVLLGWGDLKPEV